MKTASSLYNQFSFETSGLPEHPTLRTAFDLMLKCEIEDSSIHYKEMCIQRDISRALDVANGWSSDPDVIAAALLRGAYANAETQRDAFPAVVGNRIAALVQETERFDAHEDDPQRRRWSDDAKIIVYADCVQSLAGWNASLSKSFADIARRDEGQIIDPQYLGPDKVLNSAVAFIQKDLSAHPGLFSDPARVGIAVNSALAASVPVARALQAQAAAMANDRP